MIAGFRTDWLTTSQPLGVAVSGGADSIALLHLLAAQGRVLVVLHVNHRLRGAESEAEQEFVVQTAAALQLPCLIHQPELEPGNLEQSARRARYAWFHRLIQEGTVAQVATGHTQEDQAETVLFRFLRGSGTAGLSGILPRTASGLVRPMLYCGRAEVREYLSTRGIGWREDASNNWLRFARNRIRLTLLPELEQNWNPAISSSLAQTADWAQAEEDYWRRELPRITENWLRFAKKGAVLQVAALNQLPLAAARRAVRWIVDRVAGTANNMDFGHVEKVLELARRPAGYGQFRTAAWVARRSCGFLEIALPAAQAVGYQQLLQPPSVYRVPHSATEVRLELRAFESVYNSDGQLVDWALVSGSLELRDWHPGDRFQQAGHQTARKLKYFFQEAGIPSWERSGWPVITCANSILWTRGMGVSAPFLPSPATVTVLRIEEYPNESSNQKVSA